MPIDKGHVPKPSQNITRPLRLPVPGALPGDNRLRPLDLSRLPCPRKARELVATAESSGWRDEKEEIVHVICRKTLGCQCPHACEQRPGQAGEGL